MSITPFSDTQPRKVKITSVPTYASGSIDTSALDPYRQGVELTSEKHYQLGSIKISSGFDNHQVPQQIFGQVTNDANADSQFNDTDLFDPVKYISVQGNENIDLSRFITYPIKVGENSTILDGVIEPLAIRTKATFSSIDFPFESHDIFGNLDEGNSDIYRANSQISQWVELPPQANYTSTTVSSLAGVSQGINITLGGGVSSNLGAFYLDGFESMGTLTLPGSFNEQKSTISPYTDGLTSLAYSPLLPTLTTKISTAISYRAGCFEIKPGMLTSLHELADFTIFTVPSNSIYNALMKMSASTENYVPNKMYSAPTGYIYDNAPYGVDSLAFGGLSYQNG